MRNVVQRVSDQQNSLRFQVLVDCDREQEGANVSVDCAQNVVQNVNVGATVERASQRDPRLLSARKSGTLLSDDSQVRVLEEREIGLERGVFEDLGVKLGIVGLSEQNVVADRIVHNPRNLTRVGHCPVDCDCGLRDVGHLSDHATHQRRLSAPHISDDGY